MGNYKKLEKNVLLLTLGNFASKILSFLLVPLYTSVLTTKEYGIADLLTTSTNLILPIFSLLVYEAVMRFALDKESDKKQIFSVGLYTTVMGSVIVLIGAQFFRLSPDLNPYIWLFVLYYISLALYNLVTQFIKGIEKVFVYSVSGVINTLVFILCNILFLVVFETGVEGYLLSFTIGHFIATVYAFFSCCVKKYIVSWKKIEKEYYRQMFKYALPMIPNAISWWISNSSNKYILTLFWGATVNGIFSVAFKIPSILTIVVNIFISAWQISAVEKFGSEESKKFYADIYNKYESILYIGCSCLIGVITILAKFLFANEFYQAWIYTPVITCASAFNSLAAFYGSVYTSAKKTKILFFSTFLGAGANIALNFLLIPKFGAMGAALSTLLSYIIIWFVRVIDSKRILRFKINVGRNIAVYIVLAAEIVLICTENNPYYVVSIISVIIVCVLCRDVLIDVVKTIFEKLKISKNQLKE